MQRYAANNEKCSRAYLRLSKSYSWLQANAVSVSLHHLDQFDATFFHRVTHKSFNHFSMLSIHLVLGLALFLFPSAVWKVIFLTGSLSLYRKKKKGPHPPYLGNLDHFDYVGFFEFRLKFKVVSYSPQRFFFL
ncbi:hypothetical protein TNCV_2587231 [Trichonephila clavipes]|nr:hypothetical protein TNCV_2587231 [Trichonephila clavipes]